LSETLKTRGAQGRPTSRPAGRAKPVLRDEAYRRFMQLLFDGRQRPGTLISQRELCEITGCSIGAMREALKRLEAEGIVQLIPQRGVKICEVNEQELNDAYQFRRLIELPAVRHYMTVIDQEELELIRARTAELADRRPSTSEEVSDLLREKMAIDERLHVTIVGSLGNRLISDLYQKVSNQLQLSRISVQPRFSETGPAMREHLIIIDALQRGDEEEAVRAMADHLEAARLRALGLL
jgi:DNA-binding GntR family transcriptional regulator